MRSYWRAKAKKKGYKKHYIPVKDAARATVIRAIKYGRLERPSKCSRCGGGGRIDAHHQDYSKPLIVDWLCSTCHGKQHRKPLEIK